MKDNNTNFTVRAINIYKTNPILEEDAEMTADLVKLLQAANVHLPYHDEIRAFITELPIYDIDQIKFNMQTIQKMIESNYDYANAAVAMSNHKEEDDQVDYNPRLPPFSQQLTSSSSQSMQVSADPSSLTTAIGTSTGFIENDTEIHV